MISAYRHSTGMEEKDWGHGARDACSCNDRIGLGGGEQVPVG